MLVTPQPPFPLPQIGDLRGRATDPPPYDKITRGIWDRLTPDQIKNQQITIKAINKEKR